MKESSCLEIFIFCLVVIARSERFCPPPDVPIGGSYQPQERIFLPGRKIVYQCKEGFTLLGKATRSCRSSGVWTDDTPFCDLSVKLKNPRVTDNLPLVSHVIDGNNDTCFWWEKCTGKTLQLYLEEQATVHAVRIFLESGTTKIQIRAGIGSSMKVCADFDGFIQEEQWLLLKCNSDILADTIKIICTASRTINITLCEIEAFIKDEYDCDHSPKIAVAHGYFEVSRNAAMLVCEEGYQSENSRLFCEDNSWTSTGPKCEELLCDPVLNFSSDPGSKWIFLDAVSKITEGTRRQLKCISGYRKIGNPDIVVCQKNGTWTRTRATCIKEDNIRTIVIATVGTVVVIIIIVLLGITIYLINKQRNREVVVVYKPPTEYSMGPESEMEYGSARYETINPVPPNTPRPTVLPPVLDEKYILPNDSKTTLSKEPMPADIAFGTLKQSSLYGS